jgi:hypothetical protein
MRIRRLQRKLDRNRWDDDAYAYEDENGRVRFRYNLTWERMGSYYNELLERSDVALETIESAMPCGKTLRWLPIEVIDDAQAEAYLAALDELCAIVTPRASLREASARQVQVSL